MLRIFYFYICEISPVAPVAGQVTDEDCLTLNSCIKNVKVLAEKNIQNRERRDGCVVARNS